MSATMTDTKDPQALTPEEIIKWLKDNPNFLNDYPEACDILAPPREHKGKGVIDFQQYMVQRLREDREDIIEEAREIVETSRANMDNQSRIHRAVLMLLESRTFEDFVHTITMDISALLDVDIISLIVETDGDVVPHINLSGVRAVSPGTTELLMKDRAIVLEPAVNGFEDLYGGGAGLVKSQALLRLNIAGNAPPAILAFGSRDPEMFQPGQGTELISFLGLVVERCFRTWLDLPPQ